MSKTKSKGDGGVSETKEKGNDVAETIKKLGTDQLEELQKAVRAELKSRDTSEDENEKLSKLSDNEFRILVSGLVDGNKSSKKSDDEG
jgi:hypothetical protein